MTSSDQSSKDKYRALSTALLAIPIPTRLKEIVHSGGKEEVREKIEFHNITFGELLRVMDSCDTAREAHSEQLTSVLVVLEILGVISLDIPLHRANPNAETIRVCATSEAAGYLLHAIAKFLTTTSHQKSPIRSKSSIKSFRSIIESALDRNELDIHLVLANLLERNRENAHKQPLRSVRVVSVLIKGERRKRDSANKTEDVYLHVMKPAWDSYALIGSVQSEGEKDEETARLALEEDLQSPAEALVLRPSGIDDEEIVEFTITRGVYTRYSFTIWIAEALQGHLQLRDDLEYGWFTFEEICHQKSQSGQLIFTKANLLKKLDAASGLNTIPMIVTNIERFANKSIKSQSQDIIREIRDVVREFGELIMLLWDKIWSIRWWLILLIGMVVLFFILRPFINQTIPELSNIADIFGIIGFIILIFGMVLERHRRSRVK